jgi:hypothetical protein
MKYKAERAEEVHNHWQFPEYSGPKSSKVGFLIAIPIIVFTFVAMAHIARMEDKRESFIGKSVVFNNDTLMVLDYSSMRREYNLSNGLVLNQELVQLLDTVTYNIQPIK